MDSRPTLISRRQVLLLLLGLLGASGLAFAVLRIRAGRLPTLTRERYDLARAQWDAKKPANYTVEVVVRGMQPGRYVVQVEQGLPTSASFDGRPLTRPRTFGTWAVVGMFTTLARDLETHAAEQSLMLGVEFDERWGFPRRYQRIELRTGAHDALEWEVLRFEVP